MRYSGNLTFTILEAKDLLRLDAHTSVEPYVIVTVEDVKKKLQTRVQEGRNPVWDETVTARVREANTIDISVYDRDEWSTDERCGFGEFTLENLGVSSGVEKELWLNLEPQGSVHIKILFEATDDDPGSKLRSDSTQSTASLPNLKDLKRRHLFRNISFIRPFPCGLCTHVALWGNGRKCEGCGMKIHKSCEPQALADCTSRLAVLNEQENEDEGDEAEARFSVLISKIRARNLRGGKPCNPYVVMEWDGTTHTTETLKKDASPIFGYECSFMYSSALKDLSRRWLRIKVYDNVAAGKNELIGQVNLSLESILSGPVHYDLIVMAKAGKGAG
eukprot:Colp12_sorted_trinity150504_noHs@29817